MIQVLPQENQYNFHLIFLDGDLDFLLSSGFSDTSSTFISFDEESIDKIVESSELLSYSG